MFLLSFLLHGVCLDLWMVCVDLVCLRGLRQSRILAFHVYFVLLEIGVFLVLLFLFSC